MPPGPPVSATHSTSAPSTMMPNAIVTIARYGPDSRSAASATAAPITAVTAIASGSAVQKPSPSRVAASAAV